MSSIALTVSGSRWCGFRIIISIRIEGDNNKFAINKGDNYRLTEHFVVAAAAVAVPVRWEH